MCVVCCSTGCEINLILLSRSSILLRLINNILFLLPRQFIFQAKLKYTSYFAGDLLVARGWVGKESGKRGRKGGSLAASWP